MNWHDALLIAFVICVAVCIGSVFAGFFSIVQNTQIIADQAVYQSNTLKYIADLLYAEVSCDGEPDDDPDGGEPIPEASNVVDMRQAA